MRKSRKTPLRFTLDFDPANVADLHTLMRIRILLFSLMRLPFTLMRIRIRILTLIFSRFGHSNAPKWPYKASTFSLWCGPDPAFHFDPDPDPTFHFDAYSDPDPAFQNDPVPQHYWYPRVSKGLFKSVFLQPENILFLIITVFYEYGRFTGYVQCAIAEVNYSRYLHSFINNYLLITFSGVSRRIMSRREC